MASSQSIVQVQVFLIEVHPLPEEKSSSGVSKEFLTFLAKSSRILASSNGVQQDANEKDINVVFECINNDLDLDDYRIFLIEKPLEWSSYLYLKMYLPKEGVWKDMEKSFFIGSRHMRLHMPVFLHNALHFISDTSPYIIKRCHYFRPYIMAYNLESCQSTMLRLPKDARRGSHDKSCDMDYKSNGWRRILKIRVKAMGLKEADPKVQGFTIMNGDCLIFATNKKVYGYGFSGKKSWRLKEICDHEWGTKICFTSYSNTLRPCGTGATTFPT
ncbi:F-box protein [Sesbania bispinosa]|nr:F-box protein [Sesbania bispinosa]